MNLLPCRYDMSYSVSTIPGVKYGAANNGSTRTHFCPWAWLLRHAFVRGLRYLSKLLSMGLAARTHLCRWPQLLYKQTTVGIMSEAHSDTSEETGEKQFVIGLSSHTYLSASSGAQFVTLLAQFGVSK